MPTPAPNPAPPATNAPATTNGVVRVGIPTQVLTGELADALAFSRAGAVPDDRREVAALARDAVHFAVAKAIDALVTPAVEALRKHRHEAALAAARKVADEALAKVAELEKAGEVAT